MSSTDVYETALRMVERYGFGLALATAVLWFVRVDVVIPMVEAHREFLREMAQSQREMTETQRGISDAVQEQTRLLWAMQPKTAKSPAAVGVGASE